MGRSTPTGALTLGTTDTGGIVELTPLRYQFPDYHSASGHDLDANWLIIEGKICAPQGPTWCFEDACMTTWEARSLAQWLRGVVSGATAETEIDGDEQLLSFTEPNLAFALEARNGVDAIIRVYLSLEAAPKDLNRDSEDIFDFFVSTYSSLADIGLAASAWERALAPLPER